ncbi:electron transfer flavoprotein-ubiquinone oxidoreductase [Phenylobacterium sp. SCN 70-31]|uniref:electron transfer flavoprotein-ubiquinone oxidoreductase n=1 Tax=Phenylobacterium sp. SCN 70-31 TaxID=1660129 RepID=UPI00086CEF95|nr:electron transfer flavoprotein-ubiquinone oxidoreductase [Phenylobacterium sp. SCN 70-31]ODT86659.1 MAG: electron transfer flavoprotein-ubiquinone oxidoreductase [Phenylobacterium sp. SCN 70-31]
MSEAVQREAMEYDVVIVGAGPSGLAAAIRLKQLSADLTVAVVEKGAEVGAHILSGAVIDPKGISELFPNWKELGAPLETPVTKDKFVVLGPQGSLDLPVWAMPPFMNNHGNYIASLGNVCRWLGQQAEGLGVEIYPGMAASAPVFEGDKLVGVVVGEFGIGKDGQPGPNYEPGMELRGKYVFIGEGVRGSLAKVLKAKYGLCRDASPEKYGIGIKELWQVPDEVFQPGLAIHTLGWPLDDKTGGGSFMYHFGDNYVATGFVVHLNYKNPWLSPFDEFQRWKHHPEVAKYLEGGKRIAYGARAISEGGIQSVPQLYFPGGVLLGDSAGFVNVPRIKGSHNAIKSGIMAAEAAAAAIAAGRAGDELVEYKQAFDASWVKKELNIVRNAKPMLSKFGTALGTAFSGFDMWSTHLLGGFSIFGTMKHTKGDAESTGKASDYKPIVYPKPDGVLSFDKLSSVFLSSTNHDENQPAHLHLRDPSIPIDVNLPKFGEPARLYCPAGVYEVLYDDAGQNPKFQINFQNCVHCKTCDIKDPSQNIDWTTPQGGDGPNYPNM